MTVAMPDPAFCSDWSLNWERLPGAARATIEGHVVSGFASRSGDTVRVLLYSHNALDPQCRSDADFLIRLRLDNLDASAITVTEYRFDKDHNSYFRLGRSLRDASDSAHNEPDAETLEELQSVIDMLHADSVETKIAGLKRLSQLGPAAKSALGAVFECLNSSEDQQLRVEAIAAVMRVNVPQAFPADAVEKVQQLSHMRPTRATRHAINAANHLQLEAQVGAGGVNVLIIEPTAKE